MLQLARELVRKQQTLNRAYACHYDANSERRFRDSQMMNLVTFNLAQHQKL
jgi:hypothetical protein